MNTTSSKQAAFEAAGALLDKVIGVEAKNSQGFWANASIPTSKVAGALAKLRSDFHARLISETMTVRGVVSINLHEKLFPGSEGLGAGFLRVLLDVFEKTGGVKDGQAIGLTPAFPMALGGSIFNTLVQLRKQHPAVWDEMGFESRKQAGLSLTGLLTEASTSNTQASRLWERAQNARTRQLANRAARDDSREEAPTKQLALAQVTEDLLADFAPTPAANEVTAAAVTVNEIVDNGIESSVGGDFTELEEAAPVVVESASAAPAVDDLEAELAAAVAADEASIIEKETVESFVLKLKEAGKQSNKLQLAIVVAEKVRNNQMTITEARNRVQPYLGTV